MLNEEEERLRRAVSLEGTQIKEESEQKEEEQEPKPDQNPKKLTYEQRAAETEKLLEKDDMDKCKDCRLKRLSLEWWAEVRKLKIENRELKRQLKSYKPVGYYNEELDE